MSAANFYFDVSPVKKTALLILSVIDELAQPHLKNTVIKKFWNWFFISHGKNVVLNMQDEQLKIMMKKSYESLRPHYEKAELATQLKESRKLNTGKMQNFIENIKENKEVLDLIP